MAKLVWVRGLTEQEGQKLQHIVRRGSTSSVRFRRAMMLLASAGGNTVPVIARLVQADEGGRPSPPSRRVTTRTSSSRRPPLARPCRACSGARVQLLASALTDHGALQARSVRAQGGGLPPGGHSSEMRFVKERQRSDCGFLLCSMLRPVRKMDPAASVLPSMTWQMPSIS